jgi:hypothetical protein
MVLFVCFQTTLFTRVKAGETNSTWSGGYMDIHHINLAEENVCLPSFPDRTTMMIRAGEIRVTSA